MRVGENSEILLSFAPLSLLREYGYQLPWLPAMLAIPVDTFRCAQKAVASRMRKVGQCRTRQKNKRMTPYDTILYKSVQDRKGIVI